MGKLKQSIINNVQDDQPFNDDPITHQFNQHLQDITKLSDLLHMLTNEQLNELSLSINDLTSMVNEERS